MFKQINCIVCNKTISKAGAAFAAHMRKHVREGVAIEYKQGKHSIFIRSDEQSKLLDDKPYAFLGESPLPKQSPDVREITNIIDNLPIIDPKSYFITSGEAIKKTKKMITDIYSLAAKSVYFLKKLEKFKSQHKYLETSREDHKLLIKVKDPRR